MSAQQQQSTATRNRNSIAVCLVVHNEEALVRRCLESVLPIADELIVVHDGPCTDTTLNIARDMGATVYEQPYRGVAEAHRVFAFEQVTSEWIFQIDADEYIDREACAAVRELTQSETTDGYIFRWEMWNGKRALSFQGLEKLCLFRRSKTAYLGISNEVARIAGTVQRVDIFLRHRPHYNNISFRMRFAKIKKWAPIHARYYFPHLNTYACFQTNPDAWIASAERTQGHPFWQLWVQPVKHFLGRLWNGNIFGWYTWKSACMMATYIWFVHWHVLAILKKEQRSGVLVLHQYGARHHVRALDALMKEKERLLTLREFSCIKQIVRGVIRFRWTEIHRGARNAVTLVSLYCSRGRTIVLGAAPLDWRVLFFGKLATRHRVIYMTSWPHWHLASDTFVYHTRWSAVRRAWKKFIRSADSIVCVNRAGKQSLIENDWRGSEADIHVIPHAVAPEIAAPKELSRPEGALRILYVGRLVYQKGVFFLLDIARALPSVHIGIAGDGSLVGDVQKAAQDLPQVTYHGQVDQNNLSNIYDQYDCIVLPSMSTDSWEELFGMVLIEGMTRGLTPIATDCVGPREIISKAPFGYIVPQGDQSELIRCIKQIAKNVEVIRSHRPQITAYSKRYAISEVKKSWESVIFS